MTQWQSQGWKEEKKKSPTGSQLIMLPPSQDNLLTNWEDK